MTSVVLLLAAAAATAPTVVAVPPHLQYCASSNPIVGSDYAKPETRKIVFDAISDRLEQAGLTARALSIGVPFVDEIHRAPSPKATPANDDEANATYVIRICSIIPSDKVAAFPVAGIANVPAKTVIAVLCDVAGLDECRRSVEAAVLALPGGNPSKRVLLRTRQALSTDAAPQSLAAALSDSSMIILRENDQVQGRAPQGGGNPSSIPTDLAVISGELSD